MFWPCETRTSTCLSFATISSGLYRFLAIAVLLDVKDIPQVGPLQWGWIMVVNEPYTRVKGATGEANGSSSIFVAAIPHRIGNGFQQKKFSCRSMVGEP